MLSRLHAFAIFDIASVAIPSTPCLNVTVRSPAFDVSLTRDYAPRAGPVVRSLGADVEVTTRTPGPTDDRDKSQPVDSPAAAVPPADREVAYVIYGVPFGKQSQGYSFSLCALWATFEGRLAGLEGMVVVWVERVHQVGSVTSRPASAGTGKAGE